MPHKKQLSTGKKGNGSMLPNDADTRTHGNLKKQERAGIAAGATPGTITPELADASLYF